MSRPEANRTNWLRRRPRKKELENIPLLDESTDLATICLNHLELLQCPLGLKELENILLLDESTDLATICLNHRELLQCPLGPPDHENSFS